MTGRKHDTHHAVQDGFGRQILTVGALRRMLEGVDDDIHVVIDDGEYWWNNVNQVVIPADDMGDEFSAVTLAQGDPVDSRQW